MRKALLVAFLVLAACGDDGVHHLADAPLQPIDAPADAAPDAPDPKVELDITVSGAGGGTVTSSPAGITCTTASCTHEFDPNTVVTLTAVADVGSVFAGWMGACTGTNPTCDVTLAQAASVTATFDVARYAVTVTKAGVGMGTVAGNGLSCGATCTVMVDHGTMLSLTATPASLSVFAGWGGACSGSGACTVTVTGPTAITANFALDDVTLFVSKGGNGAGTVTSAPAGISCGADCSETYTAGQMVTLTAAPSTGSTFTGWSGGGCTGAGTCTVTMTAATTVTATFTLDTFALTVAKGGNGAGSVVSNPTGIACGADCNETYDYNTMVVLTATPSAGSTFTGWSGACTGTTPCMVTMTAAKSVTATFTLQTFALSVTVTGSGTVSSSPAGVSCPTDCSETYNYGTMVTLTAAAANGSTFAGWTGACTGTGACTVTIDAAKSVAASFTLNSYTVTVTPAGLGTGTVSATGISCGADCSEPYTFGTVVTLTAAPAMGSVFAGWGGACSGMALTCTLTVDAAKTVTATFDIQKFALTVTPAGTGTGTVSSAPAGISCGADCSELYNYNTSVTLTAMPDVSSTFAGWTGACTGTSTCTVTMTQARSVTANWAIKTFALTVTPAGGGSGTVSSAPAGITCGADCNQTYDYGTVVTLSASPASGSVFGGWSGAGCSGMGGCTVTMTAAANVTATFDLAQFALTVTPAGTGGGTVTSNPAGINCPTDCSENYTSVQTVVLTATPDGNSTFAGWSGSGCTGTGTCTVAMTQARSVTATFDVKQVTLTLTFSGNGSGTVTGTSSLSCTGSCTKTYPINTPITLTASPNSATLSLYSSFDAWGTSCTGTGTCSITLSGDMTVSATFSLLPNIIFTTSGGYNGSLGGFAGADAKCQGLAGGKGLKGTFVAFLSGRTVDANTRVGSATGWARVDGRPVMQTIAQFGGSTLQNPPNRDEGGGAISVNTLVYTGTKTTGVYAGTNCNANNQTADWSSPSGSTAYGDPNSVTSSVVESPTGGQIGCDTPNYHLYCLGTDRKARVQ